MDSAVIIVVISILVFALLCSVGALIYLLVRFTHLNNAINKRLIFMLFQQNDVLAQFGNISIDEMEKYVQKIQDEIRRDNFNQTPGERDEPYDPMKDPDLS